MSVVYVCSVPFPARLGSSSNCITVDTEVMFSRDGALSATVRGGPLRENLERLRELTHLTLHCAG